MADIRSNHVKVAFEVLDDDGELDCVETLWAFRRPDGFFVLDNSPFHAYGVSYRDIVAATMNEGMLTFARVVERGGHSTYRVRLPEGCDHDYFLRHWGELERFGCTYEGADYVKRLYSIDVPRLEDVAAVYAVLGKYEDQDVWEFEEAHYAGTEEASRS